MWYEIIPGFAIMLGCLVIPGISTGVIHKLTSGGKEKKIARLPWQWYMMERDVRISGTGQSHVSKGLENIH